MTSLSYILFPNVFSFLGLSLVDLFHQRSEGEEGIGVVTAKAFLESQINIIEDGIHILAGGLGIIF